MWLDPDPDKFTSKFKYVEFGQWRQDAEGNWSVFRDSKGKKIKDQPRTPMLYTWEEVAEKVKQNEVGAYTSTFQFDGPDLHKAQSISSLYFDLDSNEKKGQEPELALFDARELYDHLVQHIPESAIRIYFSGKKGFHIECEALALGIGPLADLADTFRFIANQLKEELGVQTIDFQCYDPRRMWRIPNTKHQGTGLYKVEITRRELGLTLDEIKAIAERPRIMDMAVPAQVFSPQANEWFREFIYKKAEVKISKEEMVERWMKRGSGIARDVGEQVFDPFCFEKCHALNDLWKKAEANHHLEHEERLFLCSILSYTEESIGYLHAILSNCEDYNYEKSSAHIKDWVRRRELGIGGRPYSCDRANSAGVGCGDCHLEAQEKYEVVGDRMVPTGELAAPSPIRFCYTRKHK